jgi:hypothetical protein
MMEDDFRFFKLGLGSRLIVAGALFAAAVVAELVLSVPLGFALAIAGWFPLMLRKATNEPDDQGLEQWRPVPMAEVDRLDDGLRESRKLRGRTRSLASVFAIALGLPALAIYVGAAMAAGMADAALIGANAILFLAPAALFGRVKVFTPSEIVMKMPCFRAILAMDLPKEVAVAPYIRFDKDSRGADCPEDLRLLYELKRSPADLVGIQVQISMNKGPNGTVPYMYAVVLTRGRAGPSHKAAQRFKAEGFEVESGGDDEYGTVVIRQETGGGGYETKLDDCRRLLDACLDLMLKLA